MLKSTIYFKKKDWDNLNAWQAQHYQKDNPSCCRRCRLNTRWHGHLLMLLLVLLHLLVVAETKVPHREQAALVQVVPVHLKWWLLLKAETLGNGSKSAVSSGVAVGANGWPFTGWTSVIIKFVVVPCCRSPTSDSFVLALLQFPLSLANHLNVLCLLTLWRVTA